MFLCVCKAIRTQDLEEVVRVSGPCIKKAQDQCGVATSCGACRLKVEKFLTGLATQSSAGTPSGSPKKG